MRGTRTYASGSIRVQQDGGSVTAVSEYGASGAPSPPVLSLPELIIDLPGLFLMTKSRLHNLLVGKSFILPRRHRPPRVKPRHCLELTAAAIVFDNLVYLLCKRESEGRRTTGTTQLTAARDHRHPYLSPT
uniref:Uncharacterized protein n=1 Tax=Leersia perrieri TaxID=77586 RepID=A0A0D9WGG8_9ORYZ